MIGLIAYCASIFCKKYKRRMTAGINNIAEIELDRDKPKEELDVDVSSNQNEVTLGDKMNEHPPELKSRIGAASFIVRSSISTQK